jgi:hypothetical protein
MVQSKSTIQRQEDMMSTDTPRAEDRDESGLEDTLGQSPDNESSPTGPDTEGELDEQVEESFPASDPPANY